MPFIPHTNADIQAMLDTIGVEHIEDLFAEIPHELRINRLANIPRGISEMEVGQLLQERAQADEGQLCFIGAGAYEHHIPAAVWDIASRGEFMTAYTPYQAEASQGTLQLLYEYQTIIANLMGMQVSNASLYDGASALAEAVLMAVRANRRSKARRILVPQSLSPSYRKVLQTIVSPQEIELIEIPFDHHSGCTAFDALQDYLGEDISALIIPQPNYFGALEDVDSLTDWAHECGALVIAVVNPIAMALLREPGQWGEKGADIVCGEGQPLGLPLASGGPYFGFMCCKQIFVRQLPGRIVGRTTDEQGQTGFSLTLQAREQHIRRSKATSNICTNQGLAVTAATIYMSLLGPQGLTQVAKLCHVKMQQLIRHLLKIEGVERVFRTAVFHEVLLKLSKPVEVVLASFAEQGIQAGVSTQLDYPALGNCLLICVTETKTDQHIEDYASFMQQHVSMKKN